MLGYEGNLRHQRLNVEALDQNSETRNGHLPLTLLSAYGRPEATVYLGGAHTDLGSDGARGNRRRATLAWSILQTQCGNSACNSI